MIRGWPQRILNFLRENPDIRHTSYTLWNELDTNNNVISRALHRLEKHDLIVWDRGHSGKGVKLK